MKNEPAKMIAMIHAPVRWSFFQLFGPIKRAGVVNDVTVRKEDYQITGISRYISRRCTPYPECFRCRLDVDDEHRRMQKMGKGERQPDITPLLRQRSG